MPTPASRRAVAWLLEDPKRTSAQAAARFGIARQAVHQARRAEAVRRAAAGEPCPELTAPGKVGRPRTSTPRRRTIYVPLVPPVNVMVSAEERDAFARAAGDEPIGRWLLLLYAEAPLAVGDPTPLSRYLRVLGRRAVGMDVEKVGTATSR